MNSTNSGPHRQKIILYYSLAVVLPGIILGYLAFRGILNDQALREKESRRKLEINSQAFFSAIDSGIVQFINKFLADSTFSRTQKDDLSLLVLFNKDSGGSEKLLIHHLLYLPSELLPGKPELSYLSANLKEGLRLEFAERRYPEAVKFYQNMMLKTQVQQEKIQAQVVLARLYNKMNQPDQAITLYNKIRNEYPDCLLNGQIPVGLIAGLEILKINRATGEKDEMRNNTRQYLEFLLHPPCEYDESQFDLFYQAFKEIFPEPDPMIDSLFSELAFRKIRTEILIRFITESGLTTGNGINYLVNGKIGVTAKPFNSAELAALFLTMDKDNGCQTGMVIDFQAFLKSESGILIKKLDPNSSINVKIEDNAGRLIFSRIIKEETTCLSFPFPENLPQLKLLLSENKPGFLASLLKAGSGIYLYIFILIVLLMVLGFVFTLYTLNGELRLNKLKSEFVSNVSHELKSPLTSIRMMTEMLHQNRVSSEEQKSAYYAAMLSENERLSHLIDNILDFSRIDDERKKYNFTDLNLDELMRRYLGSINERLSETDFDIRYNCPGRMPVIRADKEAMLQVVYNLVDNAIKFSGESRQIDIDLVSQIEELILSVRDYGLGISLKDQEKIFDRFFRGEEAQSKRISGSGIGLTIVKKIIEAHKGFLTLESSPGKGSTFSVHLPVNKKPQQ